jgi:DNA-directed RNA polymerase subunit K/omega
MSDTELDLEDEQDDHELGGVGGAADVGCADPLLGEEAEDPGIIDVATAALAPSAGAGSSRITIDYDKVATHILDVSTLPKIARFVTKYELALCEGTRAAMLSQGYPPLVHVDTQYDTPISIAKREIKKKLIPFLIARRQADGKFQYIRLKDLNIGIK